MNQLDKIWDVAVGHAARLVYLWTVTELSEAPVALLTNLVVMLDACPPGRYPHRLARGWHQLGFDCEDAREWIRAGVLDPVDALHHRASGYAAAEFRTTPRVVAV